MAASADKDRQAARVARNALSNLAKSFGGGALEAKRLAGRRMVESQDGGVEGLSSESGKRGDGAVPKQGRLGFET